MTGKIVSRIVLMFLLTSMLISAFDIQLVKASGTIYIRADGSIDPATANIATLDNVTYTFTGNNYDSIVIERDHITIEGANYTLRGMGNGSGIFLSNRSHVTIQNMNIKDFEFGVQLVRSNSSIISANNISNTSIAIGIRGWGPWWGGVASNNTVSNNVITHNRLGVCVGRENRYSITGNKIEFNEQGMLLDGNGNITDNIVTNNFVGIYIAGCSKLRGNEMNDNQFNLVTSKRGGGVGMVYEASYFSSIGIDTSNKINGRSIYYLVNRTNLVIDSSTHPPVGYLALINCTNVTVRNLNLTGNGEGILLVENVNCTIEKCLFKNNIIGITATTNETSIIDNKVTDNYHGITLTGYYNEIANNTVANNTLRSMPYRWPDNWPINTWPITKHNRLRYLIQEWLMLCSGGVLLSYSYNSTLYNNTLISNERGIFVSYSRFNILRQNNMTENVHNFGMEPSDIRWGENFSAVYNEINSSNMVDGKPIYYWIGRHNQEVPTDAGYVALINCTDMVVKDLQLKNNMEGIVLVAVNNTIISNNTISDTKYGIYIRDYVFHPWILNRSISVGNTIIGNNITDSGVGVCLRSENNTVRKNLLTSNLFAILSNGVNTISWNTIANNTCPPSEEWVLGWFPTHYNFEWLRFYHDGYSECGGIVLVGYHSLVTENNIKNNGFGILLGSIHHGGGSNEVYNNDFFDNKYAIQVESADNKLVHNNFVNNTCSAYINPRLLPYIDPSEILNKWNNSIEGNYWSNYTEVDSDHDGIGDSPYYAAPYNTDHHPLMGTFSNFNATSEHHVQTICNSTITDFQFDQINNEISFNVTGEDGTIGFCRICIPAALMNDTFRVFVNNTEILPPPEPLPCSNSTHNYLYFNYTLSTKEIVIIPEFPSLLILPLFMTATLLIAIVYRRKLKTSEE